MYIGIKVCSECSQYSRECSKKNLQITSDNQDDEQEVDIVSDTEPCWKPRAVEMSLWSNEDLAHINKCQQFLLKARFYATAP
jgi:hypothetical protein